MKLTVKQRKRNLKYIGYYFRGSITSDRNKALISALKAFQKSQKLSITGIYDNETEIALIQYVKDVQKALIRAGFRLPKYGADGVVGSETISAIKKFQKKYKLKIDGIAGVKTFAKLEQFLNVKKLVKVDWSKIEHFERKEFVCPCNHCNGFPVDPELALVELLERARKHFNLPIHITSGVRCVWQNERVGGIANSKHKQGKAADCSLDFNSDNDLKLKKWFQHQPEVEYTYTGFGAVHVNIK